MKQVSLAFALMLGVAMFAAGLAVGSGAVRSPALQAATPQPLSTQQLAQPAAMQQGGLDSEASPVATSSGTPDALHLFQMKDRLRELLMLEEVQYADLGTYTQDMSKLAAQRHPSDTVEILFRYAGQDGWVADASHPALPGRTCVVYVGDAARLPASAITARDGVRPGHPAEIACDE